MTKAIITKPCFKGWHIEITRNPVASWDYCKKDDTKVEEYVMYGKPPKGKKEKILGKREFREMLCDKGAKYMLDNDHISPYHYNNLKKVCEDYKKKIPNLD